jgi:integrase
MAKKLGRSKGAKTKGYFYRAGRGWYTKIDGKFEPLHDEHGERLREKETDARTLKEAFRRSIRAEPKVPESAATPSPEGDAQVGEVCAKYLADLKAQAGEIGPHPKGMAKTYRDRGQTLFDFCYGLPGEFFCDGDVQKREAKGNAEAKRIHDGFGHLLCSELTQAHVDDWLNAHAWEGGRRTRIQALKRALNFGVERKMISVSPLRGMKVPRTVSRVTYLTPEQETAIVVVGTPEFRIALKVCIRTGARFGSEFAALESRHVRDHGSRMEWVFKPSEHKTGRMTGRQRTILVTDPEILEIIRKQMKEHPSGPLFRSASGEPWNRRMLSQNFRRAKARLSKKGISLDTDACMYSCRHTFAKRVLEGYWTGKPTSIKTLARLMGNTVQVCIAHYLQFSEADNEMLWDAV